MNEPRLKFPATSIDVVVLTLKAGQLHVALQARSAAPYEGQRALIGGIVKMEEDKDLEATVARVLQEKAGLAGIYAEQLYTFGSNIRDPRGWTVAVTYIALVPLDQVEASDRGIELAPVDGLAGLAFDHDRIVDTAVGRVRGKGAYSVLPARFLAAEFSLPEMMRVYEQVMGTKISLSSFTRKVMDLGIVELTGERRILPGSTRPSAMYRLTEGAGTFDRKL